MKGNLPTEEFSGSVTGNYYSDNIGLKLDPLKEPKRIFITRTSYDRLMEGTTPDNGKAVGIGMPLSNPEFDGVHVQTVEFDNPFLLTELTTNTVTFNSQNTSGVHEEYSSFGAGWSKLEFTSLISLRWRSNVIVNAGNFNNMVCHLKGSEFMNVKWTGVPAVDSYITKSGKAMYNFVVDMIIECHEAAPFEPHFEWKLDFNIPYTQGWNFILNTVVDVITSPYFDYSLNAITPSLHVSPLRPDRVAEVIEEDEIADHAHTSPSLNIYPLLEVPSAPPGDAHPTPQARPSIYKRIKRFLRPSLKNLK